MWESNLKQLVIDEEMAIIFKERRLVSAKLPTLSSLLDRIIDDIDLMLTKPNNTCELHTAISSSLDKLVNIFIEE